MNFGWVIWTDKLAGGDCTKWNTIFEMPVVEVLNIISFKIQQLKNAE